MENLSDCLFFIPNGQRVYRPGEKVKGRVSVVVSKDTPVKGVHLYLYGAALSKWLGGTSHVVGIENYIGLVLTLHGNKPNTSGDVVTLTAGKHAYAFTFTLPESGIPSSFEGSCGAVRYWLKIQFVLPAPSRNRAWYRFFTVLAVSDVNTRENMLPKRVIDEKPVNKVLGLGSSGKLKMNILLDRSAYCPGEVIFVDLEVKNESSKEVGQVKVGLLQQTMYRAGRDTLTANEYIRRILVGSNKIAAGDIVEVSAMPLPVDAVPPTTVPFTCHIIKVKYFVEVVVEVPFGYNVKKLIPITIGTVPLKSGSGATSVESEAAGATNVSDVSFRVCQFGIHRFMHSEDIFPRFHYVPLTAYAEHQPNQFPLGTVAEKSSITNLGVTGPVIDAAALENQTGSLASVSSQLNVLQPPEMFMGAPPSYEEATATPEKPPRSLDPQEKGAILLIRFPRSDFLDVEDYLNSNKESLSSYGGCVLTICPGHLLREYAIPWPSKSSTAVFFFGSGKKGEEWFGNIAASNPALASRWSAMVAESSKKRSAPNPQHQFVNVAFVKYTSKPSKEDVEKIRAIQREKGMRMIVRSTQPKFLCGDWSVYFCAEHSHSFAESGSGSSMADTEDVGSVESDAEAAVDESGSEATIPKTVEVTKSSEFEMPAQDNEVNEEATEDDDSNMKMYVVCYQYPDVVKYTEYYNTVFQNTETVEAAKKIKKHIKVVTSVCFSGGAL